MNVSAASIISKKGAEGLSALVLDVKEGKGAMLKNPDDAKTLARTMVRTGQASSHTSVLAWAPQLPCGSKHCSAIHFDCVGWTYEIIKQFRKILWTFGNYITGVHVIYMQLKQN